MPIVADTLADDHAGFLEWARSDPMWQLVVAECATRVCAKPREAASFILLEGLRELLADEGVVDD